MHIGWYIDEPSPGRAPHPVADPLVSLLVAPPPLALGSPTRTGASGPRLQLRPTQYSQQPLSRSTSRRKTPCHGFQDSKAIHQTTAAADDLAGHLDHRRTERPKLHPQQRSLLGPMLLSVPGRLGHQQRGPSLQAPSQTSLDFHGGVFRLSIGPGSIGNRLFPRVCLSPALAPSMTDVSESQVLSRGLSRDFRLGLPS